jgi:hypothetical protein
VSEDTELIGTCTAFSTKNHYQLYLIGLIRSKY